MNKQKLEQKYYQGLSQQQIQFLGLLQTPIISLEKRIEEEIEENPALEEEEEEVSDDENSSLKIRSNINRYEDLQITDKNESLEGYLSKQLIDLNLDEETLYLVNYLINSLDSRGFLSRDLYSISSDLLASNESFSEKNLKSSLTILQNLDPPGVGAKNLQECLLIQLKKKHPNEKIAHNVISKFYSAFSNKNYEYLIKELNISKKKLKYIYQIIERLKPIPSDGFSKTQTSAKYVYPDFTIKNINGNLELQLNTGNVKTLKISKYYSELLNKTTDSNTKDFLAKNIAKAKWFKESMEKRSSTLTLVMSAIIKFQKEYLISGSETDLKPMKLADIANIVNMDISTISRVSNAKYVEAYFGTFKLKELFTGAYKKSSGEVVSTKEIKKRLKRAVLLENKTNPLTDEKLSEILAEEGFHISRRTTTKYREQLGIESSKLRRELE